MTFNELTCAIAFFAALLAAFLEGRNAGVPGVLIGVVIGVGFGICNVFLTRVAFKWVGSHPELGKRTPTPAWTALAWALLAALFACICAVSLLAMLATRIIVRHVAA
jgi:hypothetical protein